VQLSELPLVNNNTDPPAKAQIWSLCRCKENNILFAMAIPGHRTNDAMAGFLTYRLRLWPPSH